MPSPASAAPESDRLKKLRQQQEELAQKIRLEESRLKEQARKDDTRRKILAGAVALDLAENNPQFRALLYQAFDRSLESERDRALFGLVAPSAPVPEARAVGAPLPPPPLQDAPLPERSP